MTREFEKTLPKANVYHPETRPMQVSSSVTSLENDSLHGATYMGKGEVVFRLSKCTQPLEINIGLQEGTHLGPALVETKVFEWLPSDGDIFVRFKDFPARYTRNHTYCYFDLWVVPKDRNPNNSTTIEVQILSLA